MTVQLDIWAVYKYPKDYPGKFVARRWITSADGERATGDVIVRDTYEGINREMLIRGLTRIARNPQDDPVIVESWL